ncbi:unnamed protein product [Closterium sp. Naga37s-1]|nr:unnamed protein product [Closterium sp. Naga37s-1]
MRTKLEAKQVVYCGVCGLPPEFCEFGPDFNKCKPWLLEHTPELYPDLAAEKLKELSTAEGGAGEAGAGAAAPAAAKPEEPVKKLPGGRVKKQDKKEVVVERIVRNKRKSVTVIKGLEHFGVKLPEAAKKLGKKFASGASVVKGPTEKEQVDVQGDILLDIVDFITATWPDVPEEAIYFIEDGKKVPAC